MIKRKLLSELRKHLDKKEITLLVGPRQAGKTTLLMVLEGELKRAGEKTAFFNLDIETDRVNFTSQETLLRKIELEIGKRHGFVFIDEIQRKENAGLFLKGIYDMNLPYKFIVSGSGSLELKEKIHESLAGRKRIFELTTLSFTEFADFKTDYKYEGKLLDFFQIDKIRTKSLLEEYLNFGGYPRVVLLDTIDEKRKAVGELYESYLERDINHLLGIGKTESFTKLVQVLASQIGELVNVSELSSTLSISSETVKNYLWYLEKTFLVRRVTPFFKNRRAEITKSPIYYFQDLGLRNFALQELGNATRTSSAGFLFQNFIFNFLFERVSDTASQIHFWRTKDKAEVDFVLDTGREIIPIEVKFAELKRPEVTRSLLSFIERYQSPHAFVVHLGEKFERKFADMKVDFLPFYRVVEKRLFTTG